MSYNYAFRGSKRATNYNRKGSSKSTFRSGSKVSARGGSKVPKVSQESFNKKKTINVTETRSDNPSDINKRITQITTKTTESQNDEEPVTKETFEEIVEPSKPTEPSEPIKKEEVIRKTFGFDIKPYSPMQQPKILQTKLIRTQTNLSTSHNDVKLLEKRIIDLENYIASMIIDIERLKGNRTHGGSKRSS